MMNQWLRPVLGGLFLAALVCQFTETMPGQQAAANGHDCDVAPRSYANISSLLGAPPSATPAATTGGDTLERGVPATAAERTPVGPAREQNAGKTAGFRVLN